MRGLPFVQALLSALVLAQAGLARADQAPAPPAAPAPAAVPATAAVPAPATALTTEDLARARTYVTAGGHAYEAGQFLAAVQAFEQAYRIAPRPIVLFDIAQGYHRQYTVDHAVLNLKSAVDHYRRYVAEDPKGKRRLEAVQALGDLEAELGRVRGAPDAGGGAPSAPAPAATRVVVSSQTPNATVSLDGKPPVPAPLIEEVKAGPHLVVVSAAGFFDEQAQVVAVQGALAAREVELRERPGLLMVVGPPGGVVAVDGRSVGTTPLAHPLELPAGPHFVTLRQTGHVPAAQEVTLARGALLRIEPKLEVTSTRVGSYVDLGIGAATLVAAGVLWGVAEVEQGQANTIGNARANGSISEQQRETFNADLDRRNGLFNAAGATAGVGGAAVLTGALLYLLDSPRAPAAPARAVPADDGRKSPSIDLSFAPLLGRGLAGGGLRGSF
jgi:hypothetical protein